MLFSMLRVDPEPAQHSRQSTDESAASLVTSTCEGRWHRNDAVRLFWRGCDRDTVSCFVGSASFSTTPGRSVVRALRGLMLVGGLLALLAVGVFAGPATAAKAGNATVRVCKQIDSAGFRNLGQCVSSATRGGGPPASGSELDIETATYTCAGAPLQTCWGIITGSGLNPNSGWAVFDGSFVLRAGQTDSNGSISATPLELFCFGDTGALFAAQAESSAGHVITAVGAPC